MAEGKTHTGGCHCGGVRFEFNNDLSQTMTCNCSICQKAGFVWAFGPETDFKLFKGEDLLTDYQFNKKAIHHLFCKICGVRSFSRGKNPDGSDAIAVNVRCLDDVDLSALATTPFDGKSL